MKAATLLLVLTWLCVAGCDAPPAPPPESRRAGPEQAGGGTSSADAQRQYREFLAEAEKAAALMEAHPGREALREMSIRLHDLVNLAGDSAAANDKITALVEEGRMAIRFFDACLKVANFQARRSDIAPEKAKSYVDKTCDANLPPFRESLRILRTKLESEGGGTPGPPGRPPGASVQETR